MKVGQKLAWALAALLALAMGPATPAVTPTPAMLQIPKIGLQSFLQGTDTPQIYKTLYTGGTNGSKIIGLTAASYDGSVIHGINCQVSRSSVGYTLWIFLLPINANGGSAPTINGLSPTIIAGLPIDSDGNPFLYLQPSDIFQCTYTTAFSTGGGIIISAIGADF